MVPVTAAGGVIFRKDAAGIQVLIIRRNGHWDLPKGKLEPGESVQACAVREVSEELGIDPSIIVCSLDATWHIYEMEGESYGKTTHWYLMVNHAQSFVPQAEENIEEVRWAHIDDAIGIVAYENLRIVLERAKAVLGKPS
jgi:8-oxo-dGTP pyrophosphatase MutT (NUDIX family)